MNLRIGLLLLVAGALQAHAQRSELGLLLGASSPRSRTPGLEFTRGTSLYANYGIRLKEWTPAALFFEVPFVATPQHRIESPAPSATRDVATIYLTPGLRLKLLPKHRVSPYVAAGAGWALFEQSTTRLDGRPNEAPRTLSRGAFNFGGGVDIHLWRFIGLRGEVRDFISGNPAFNTTVRGSTQHNIIAAGGFVLRF